jgi:hypothetical protein
MKLTSLQSFCYINKVALPVRPSIRDRIDSIESLAASGLSRDEIASRLNIKLTSLQEWCSRHKVKLPKRSSTKDPTKDGNVIIRASMPTTLAEGLKTEAQNRQIGVSDLSTSILAAVAEGNLYNAVLEQ